ncbi:MAG: secondary thiamine-phosphate synthase enzyme YjbQ [Halothermotrichaceae bacterium]
MFEKINVKTSKRTEIINITAKVENIINKANIKEGIVIIYVPHTTAGVTINESADSDVVRDIKKEINKIVPFDDNYKHFEGNSAAHIKSSLFGSSETIIIEDGVMQLGRWQGIFFCEFDGARTRNIFIKIING